MADHLHQQVLDAYQATLVAAATSAASRVYLDRLDELPQASVPALLIEGRGESVENIAVDWQHIQQRAYTFTVTAIAATNAAARNLAKQVEQALFASLSAATAGSKAKQLRLVGGVDDRDGAAATGLHSVTQTYVADLVTLAGTPDAAY